ncbi:MAG: hypothetical protein HC881_20325 [Leptolyngbyaceae cyanobacterium SL_7_1]|nr:hypothetical protein [Leptolyngbyaceae cyanobacterium SL_7_1]
MPSMIQRSLTFLLTILLTVSSLIWSAPAHAQLATTMPQEDSKPLSRYAFERVEGDTTPSGSASGELSEIKSAREFRENITKPIGPATEGAGASGNSEAPNDSVEVNQDYARTRIKQAVHPPQ